MSGPLSAADGNNDSAVLAGGGGVAIAGDGSTIGVQGLGPTGVKGIGTNLAGVHGLSQTAFGVHGQSSDAVGVFGETSSVAYAAVGGNNYSVDGGTGVGGQSLAPEPAWGAGVTGLSNGVGVYGESRRTSGGIGVHGFSENGTGVNAGSKNSVALYAETYAPGSVAALVGKNHTNGVGVHGVSNGGLAGWFSGDVRIETNLSVEINAFKPGGGSWANLSDRRTKTAIEPLRGALRQLLQLRGVTFRYTNPAAFRENEGTQMGVVAQDVEQVFPTWVDTGTDGYKRVTFRGFEAVAVEAVREVDANTQDAVRRIEQLERQNEELRRAVDALSAAVRDLQK